MPCSICNQTFQGFGNNASPINNGRCCNTCNTKVIEARFKSLVENNSIGYAQGMFDIEMRKRMFESFQKRQNCWKVCKEQMTNSIGKGKGVKNRKWFVERLKMICNYIFVDDDTEYKYIKKYGRGMWSKDIVESFNKEDQDYIVNFIAKECGAFDY